MQLVSDPLKPQSGTFWYWYDKRTWKLVLVRRNWPEMNLCMLLLQPSCFRVSAWLQLELLSVLLCCGGLTGITLYLRDHCTPLGYLAFCKVGTLFICTDRWLLVCFGFFFSRNKKTHRKVTIIKKKIVSYRSCFLIAEKLFSTEQTCIFACLSLFYMDSIWLVLYVIEQWHLNIWMF